MSYSEIDNLLKEIAKVAFDGKLVVFAGAGISKSMGIPDWTDLLKDLCKKSILSEYANDLDSFNEKYNVLADRCENHEIAQECYGKIDNVIYKETVRKNLKATSSQYSSAHMKILKLRSTIVTTNYDSGFRNAFNDYFYIKGRRDDYCEEILPEFDCQFLPNKVIYLHGKDNEDNIVLKTDDYEIFYNNPDSDLFALLRLLFKKKTLLFIGFSFDDIYILEAFRTIFTNNIETIRDCEGWKPGSGDRPNHYAFLSEPEQSLVEILESIGIKPVPHPKGIYIEGQNYIDKICEYIDDIKKQENTNYGPAREGLDALSR